MTRDQLRPREEHWNPNRIQMLLVYYLDYVDGEHPDKINSIQ